MRRVGRSDETVVAALPSYLQTRWCMDGLGSIQNQTDGRGCFEHLCLSINALIEVVIWNFCSFFVMQNHQSVCERANPAWRLSDKLLKRNLHMPIEFRFLFLLLFTSNITHLLPGFTETQRGLWPAQRGWTLPTFHAVAMLLCDWGCIQFTLIKLGFDANINTVACVHAEISFSFVPSSVTWFSTVHSALKSSHIHLSWYTEVRSEGSAAESACGA